MKEILDRAIAIGCMYQMRYIDYSEEQFTVPVILNKERVDRILDDNSIVELKLHFYKFPDPNNSQ